MKLLTATQMKRLDELAINEEHIPSLTLMENAAAALSDEVMKILPTNRNVYVFCGSGNNGGDGIAAARILKKRGAKVRVFLAGSREKMTDDSKAMQSSLSEASLLLEDFQAEFDYSDAGLCIDALFGTGLNSPLRGVGLEAAKVMNSLSERGIPVVSADIPSGVSADTGEAFENAVKADITVTFSCGKVGLFTEPGCIYAGKVIVAPIGVPQKLIDAQEAAAYTLSHEDLSLPRRPRISHKGDYGRCLLLCGSIGYTGAAYLASQSCVRSGAGLVFLGCCDSIYPILASKCVEAMPFPLGSDSAGRLCIDFSEIESRVKACDCTLIGPGLGRSENLDKLVRDLVINSDSPLILDADGINALSSDINVLDRAKCTCVLTPHEGEFLRIGSLENGRLSAACDFAKKHNCIMILKGHRTILAFPDLPPYILTIGNPGMATGGSGDVLSGILCALAAQLPLYEAVKLALWLHSRAGDICSEYLGEYSMAASDLINALPQAFKELE